MVLAGRLENDIHWREAEYQRQLAGYEGTIVEFQHDVHCLNSLHDSIPLLGVAEMNLAVLVAADDGASNDDDEEEDPEELMEINESDDEGGHVSGVDNGHDN
jgi:hypothetical protein